MEGSRITVVADLPKYDMTKDPPEPIGNYIWIFEVKEDGTLRFVPEGSDEFKVDHGTFPLNENSVLVRTGDLKKPINAGQGGS